MPHRPAPLAAHGALTAILLMLPACTDSGPPNPEFERTGELIALSGGDAGPLGACITCHGPRGEGNGGLSPRLAGLDAGYIVRQLENYAAGMREHPQMTWIAGRLSRAAQVKLGDYYAALETSAAAAPEPIVCEGAAARLYQHGDPARGLASCASCHGAAGEGAGEGNPPLAGQSALYQAEQLRQWRDGERTGDPQRVMWRISRQLDETELRPLADYSAALPGASPYRRSPAACPPARRPDPRSGA